MSKEKLPVKYSEVKANLVLQAKTAQKSVSDWLASVEPQSGNGKLPLAALVYGGGAAAFVAFSLWHFSVGGVFYGLLLLAIAGLLFAFAILFMKKG